MFYSIATDRNLTQDEIEVLTLIFKQIESLWIKELSKLKVLNRCCGCGKCPTAVFDDNFTKTIDLSTYKKKKNTSIKTKGVTILGNSNTPNAIEFW